MKHNDKSDIINSLITARISKGLSQSEMARRIGLPQSYVSRLESGRLDARISSIQDIARFLELDIMLIPASMQPIVESLLKSDERIADRPLYTLDDTDESI